MSIHLNADFAAHEFGKEGVPLVFKSGNLRLILKDFFEPISRQQRKFHHGIFRRGLEFQFDNVFRFYPLVTSTRPRSTSAQKLHHFF